MVKPSITQEYQSTTIYEGKKTGSPALGYEFVHGGGVTRIAFDPELAPLIKRAFESVADGTVPQEAHRTAVSGGLADLYDQPIGLATFYYLLSNPYYAGMARRRGGLAQGDHPPLVTAELFDRVQEILAAEQLDEAQPIIIRRKLTTMSNTVPTLTYDEFKKDLYQARGKQVSEGTRNRVLSGAMAGPAPLGYENVRTHLGAKAIFDKQRAPLIKEAFLMASEGKAFRQILAVLAQKGLTTKRGSILSIASLHAMLTNPFYMGLVRCGDELIEGRHEPTVSKELFDQVQDMLAMRRY